MRVNATVGEVNALLRAHNDLFYAKIKSDSIIKLQDRQIIIYKAQEKADSTYEVPLNKTIGDQKDLIILKDKEITKLKRLTRWIPAIVETSLVVGAITMKLLIK